MQAWHWVVVTDEEKKRQIAGYYRAVFDAYVAGRGASAAAVVGGDGAPGGSGGGTRP